jgi:acetyltransferase-like isoleucine patch superfamily enzyme
MKRRLSSYLTPRQKTLIKRMMAFASHHTGGNTRRIKGRNNVVSVSGTMLRGVTFDIEGHDNRVLIASGSILNGTTITMRGSGHLLEIGTGCRLEKGLVVFEDRDCRILIGDGTTIEWNLHLAAVEPGAMIGIGRDCMFSRDIDLRTSDSHSILDLATGARINKAEDIGVGDHVWLGAGVTVMKGVRIGDDAVVGMRSIVTADIPAHCVAVGSPARVVRRDTTWKRVRIYD